MIKAVEFFCGIGGLHQGLLQGLVCNAEIVAAYDWDPAAIATYEANYGKGIVHRKDIGSLQPQELEAYNATMWMASPACQPYTVLGLGKGAADPRAKSFIHLMEDVLPTMVERGTQPEYIFVENVAGFETSSTRLFVLEQLAGLRYYTAEFLLTPKQYGIPNSRLRYYLVAKRTPFQSDLPSGVLRNIPIERDLQSDETGLLKTISDYLEPDDSAIPDRVLERWGRLFDVVLPSSTSSCCFTRGYTHMVEGSGSILQTNESIATTEAFQEFMQAQEQGRPNAVSILHQLSLRYFSPEELLRLFHLSSSLHRFVWPSGISRKTQYRLIGNSVNVAVIRRVISFLCSGLDATTV